MTYMATLIGTDGSVNLMEVNDDTSIVLISDQNAALRAFRYTQKHIFVRPPWK